MNSKHFYFYYCRSHICNITHLRRDRSGCRLSDHVFNKSKPSCSIWNSTINDNIHSSMRIRRGSTKDLSHQNPCPLLVNEGGKGRRTRPVRKPQVGTRGSPGDMLWSSCLVPKVRCFGTPHPSPQSRTLARPASPYLPLSLTIGGEGGDGASAPATSRLTHDDLA